MDRADLPPLTLLLFGGPARVEEIADALQAPRRQIARTLERLELAGYARREPASRPRVELTDHARQWIERIWGPLREDGVTLLKGYPAPTLTLFMNLLTRARELQEMRARQLRTWLQVPDSLARRPHLRGGV